MTIMTHLPHPTRLILQACCWWLRGNWNAACSGAAWSCCTNTPPGGRAASSSRSPCPLLTPAWPEARASEPLYRPAPSFATSTGGLSACLVSPLFQVLGFRIQNLGVGFRVTSTPSKPPSHTEGVDVSSALHPWFGPPAAGSHELLSHRHARL